MTEKTTKAKPGRKPKQIHVTEVADYVAPTPPAAPTPEPPNPAIASLQEDIIQLVKQRSGARGEISNAMLALNQANARLTAAKDYLMGLEQEVQYRMNLIAQMRGGNNAAYFTTITGAAANFPEVDRVDFYRQVGDQYIPIDNPDTTPNGYGVTIPDGVGSIPAPRNITTMPSGPRIRSESAVAERNAEISTRAAI